VLIRVKQSDLAMLQVVVGLLVGEKELSEVSSEMREIACSCQAWGVIQKTLCMASEATVVPDGSLSGSVVSVVVALVSWRS
jgi:hypothetical protein